VTVVAGRLDGATPARSVATRFELPRAFVVLSPFQRVVGAVGDMLGVVAVVLCVPFVILAIGLPLALGVRLLLWLGGLLWPGLAG